MGLLMEPGAACRKLWDIAQTPVTNWLTAVTPRFPARDLANRTVKKLLMRLVSFHTCHSYRFCIVVQGRMGGGG